MIKNLSVVVPTFNEKDNIDKLYSQIKFNLNKLNINWDIIFVDDSLSHDTANVIKKLQENENNIFLIKRFENRGLSSALIQGALSSNSEYVVFIDADLQHPPEKIKDLYNEIISKKLHLVSASRFLEKNKFLDKTRYKASLFVNYLLEKIFKIKYSDILTGFFIVKRSFFDENYKNLSNIGFKILLDIVISNKKSIKFSEIPFKFEKRHTGESKLNSRVLIDFITLVLDKIIGKFIPARYFIYSFIGTLGVLFQISIFYILLNILNFTPALITSIFFTIFFNYFMNNEFTYSDLKKKGNNFYKGLIKYYFFCFFGAIFNFVSAWLIFKSLNNFFLSVLIGAFVGSIWNYSMNTLHNWKK
tara:strand:- start:3497 stop:4573 length:1077 start_codon:yes stop_codon:yes gene_type:complete